MPRSIPPLFPRMSRQLADFGERLRLARLRRRYSAVAVAARAGISRSTLVRVEAGDPAVSLGTYASVLHVLGMQADWDAVGRDDALGRRLQDMRMLPPRRGKGRGDSPAHGEGA